MDKIKKFLEKEKAINSALTILHWDLETEAPKEAVESISKTIGILSEMSYLTLVNDEFKNLVYSKDENKLNDLDKKLIKEIKKNVFEKMSKIPVEIYSKYSELVTKSTQLWSYAKQNNDLSIYAKTLEEVIKYQKEFIKYRGYTGHPYSLLLNDYEEGLTIEKADEFFNKLKNELTPFIKKIITLKREKLEDIKKRFYSKEYPIDKQKLLSKEVTEILKFNYNRGVIKESEHPFTTNVNNRDVRITTHYYLDNPISAIYSTIHETGHALYELQVGDKYQNNFLGGGVSMGIHESQSRIFENMFCKHPYFLDKLYNLIDKYFTIDITKEEFNLLLNEVNTSLIRVEADELTYPIHVMIRYEIEKEIFSDLEKEENAYELAEKWANKYEEYLGIRPSTYSEGILQDIHWSQGSFGYFSSYAIGSANAAQIYSVMSKELDLDNIIKNLEFEKINEWLKENIHQYGSYLSPKEVILNSTKEEFNPNYYINYLKDKFSKIYDMEEDCE